MYLFKKRRYQKKYAATLDLLEKNNLPNLRKKIKILIVDDESDDIYQILKERQYDVYYKSDMTYSIEAEPFEIVIMDIRGVAKRLHSNMEGFALACDVKKKYPLKRVCCYSGSIHKEISEQLSEGKVDAFFVKDLDIDKMCEKIDSMILSYADYKIQWEVLRRELVNNKIDDADIEKIYKAYEEGFRCGDLMNLNETVVGVLQNGTVLLNVISSIISLLKVSVV